MGLYINHKQTKFQVGDTVKVFQTIKEGGKKRTQVFEGLVIKVKGHKNEKTFTVRKISSGIGVERIWPIDTPMIEKIEVVKQGKVRRSKLYYLRERIGRSALKVRQRHDKIKKEKIVKSKKTKKIVEKSSKNEDTKRTTKSTEQKTRETGGTVSKKKATK